MWRITLAVALCAGVVATQATTIETVPIGNLGNVGDPAYTVNGTHPGAVSYAYSIGKYEITAGQYTDFLNAVADTDTYALFNPIMQTGQSGSYMIGIQQSGVSGSFTYSVAADWANRPVTWVSLGDTYRFANWMANGQPTGPQGLTTTEDGSYLLNGAMTGPDLMAVTRKAGARWALASEDEWYKAAFHKNDGDTSNYWLYATSSSAQPSKTVVDPDPGNNANFYQAGNSIGPPYYRTPVGEFENSESPYGTFDQSGNVQEWTEGYFTATTRAQRGGAFDITATTLRSSSRVSVVPSTESRNVGFRLVAIPEPTSLALLAVGLLVASRRR